MSITDADLIDLAGPGAFDRGYDYYREGRVVELETHDGSTTAFVDGTTMYRVTLRHDTPELNGSCDCPASDGVYFCKHCVATALALRDHLASSALAVSEKDVDALRDYLADLDAGTLASYLTKVVHKDPPLYEQLKRRAQLEKGPVNASEFKRSITQATPLVDLFEPGKVRAYFRHLASTLQGISGIADQLTAAELLEVVLHTFARLDKALERVDDSFGYRYEAQELACSLHCQALQRGDWSAEWMASHLLELALSDPADQFAGVPFDYAGAIGEEGVAAFFNEVERRLAALPKLPIDASFDDKWPYLQLTFFLRARAEEQENWDELIRLDELTATTEVDFERIAASCLRAGKPKLAGRWLEKADALDQHDRSSRNELWAEVHAEFGDWDAAVSARLAAFRRDVSYKSFQRLMEFANHAACADSTRDSVVEFLRAAGKPGAYPDEIHAYTLVQILREGEDWPSMADTAVARIQSPERLLQVAQWLAESAPGCAVPVVEKAVEVLINKKTNRYYRSAVHTLFQAKPVFDASGVGAFDDCVQRIREAHYRKRNLMVELDERLRAT